VPLRRASVARVIIDLERKSLTAREFDIFRMIAEAKSIAEIAATLNLSSKTIFNYHYMIKSKLTCRQMSNSCISPCD
jgi:DNA-binding CsgD family transcriptional regulator